MSLTISRLSLFVSCLTVLLIAPPAVAQESKAKLASEGRFDLSPDNSVGRLTDGEVTRGDGRIERMSWLQPPERDRGYVVAIPATHRGWREFEIRFTPAGSGKVTLALKGPWEDSGQFKPFRQDVEWDVLSAEGTTLANGDFEGATPQAGWTGGNQVAKGTQDAPAKHGEQFIRVWHDTPLFTELQVTAGTPVVLRGFVRAARPEGFVEMRRITTRDTAAHKASKQFLKGVNFGNFLEVPKGQDWGANYSLEDVDRVKKEGFDHIRLPIGWHNYTGSGPEFRIEPEFFEKVDAYVNLAVDHGLWVIINIHHFDAFTSNPAEQKPKLIAIWRQLAEHYQGHPGSVAFEILNEPKDAATTEVMNTVFADVIPVIRESNPDRTIFVGPGRWNQIGELANLRLPDNDENLIVTVHSYDPHVFTHQGASWGGPELEFYRGVQFPGPPMTPFVPRIRRAVPPKVQEWINAYNTKQGDANPCSPAKLQALIDTAREWSDYYGRPVHLGEFGAFEAVDAKSKANYCREFRTRAEGAGIGWALWDWRAGFRYWDSKDNHPEPGMREAMFGTD